jgi:hypothetical protein
MGPARRLGESNGCEAEPLDGAAQHGTNVARRSGNSLLAFMSVCRYERHERGPDHYAARHDRSVAVRGSLGGAIQAAVGRSRLSALPLAPIASSFLRSLIATLFAYCPIPQYNIAHAPYATRLLAAAALPERSPGSRPTATAAAGGCLGQVCRRRAPAHAGCSPDAPLSLPPPSFISPNELAAKDICVNSDCRSRGSTIGREIDPWVYFTCAEPFCRHVGGATRALPSLPPTYGSGGIPGRPLHAPEGAAGAKRRRGSER